MIKIIKPGIPQYEYTNTCSECMCVYSYQNEDIFRDYNLTTSFLAYIICPYCGARNSISTYIPPKQPYEYWKITCETESKNLMDMLKIAEGDING